MTEEAYVSFKTAKLLKEKGFDEFCHAYYEDEDNPNINLHSSKAINWNKTEFISKPTQQLTMRWLREVHKIFIEIYADTYNSKDIIFNSEVWDKNLNSIWRAGCFTTYEQACESAIKYCLENLI